MGAGSIEEQQPLKHNAPFRYLLGGHAVSALGDWVATFGLMLFVRDLTRGSAIEGLAISGILGFRILPALVAAPIASSIIDRFDRRRVMIVTDITRACLIAIVPFAPHLGAIYAIAFAVEGLSLVFLPARDALVPRLVPPHRLAGANGLIMISQWGSIPIAGGLVVAAEAASGALAGVPFIGFLAAERFALPFFFDSFTFLVSAALILAIPAGFGRIRHAAPTPAPADHTRHAVDLEMMQGIRYLMGHRSLRHMVLGLALATAAGGALFAIGIPYVKTTLGASDSVFGALVALWGVGMALGAWIAQRSHRRESDLFRLALGGSGLILMSMALVPRTWLALGVSVAFGAGLATAMVLGITLAQRHSPEEVRGRVMSAIHVVARICLIAGAVIVGGLAAGMDRLASTVLPGWDGNRYAFLIAGITLAAGGLAAKTGALQIETDFATEEPRSDELTYDPTRRA